MKPCIPPEVQLAAEQAEKRRNEAMALLLAELKPEAPADPFEKALSDLIDADKKVVRLRQGMLR